MRRDLILGVAAGAIVVIAVALAIRLLSDGDGDGAASGGEPCSIGPAALRVPISEETFERGDDRLRRIAEAATENDYDAVWRSFYPFTRALADGSDERQLTDPQLDARLMGWCPPGPWLDESWVPQ